MIALHRLSHRDEPFHINPDLVISVEAHPDTVVTLTTGTKVVVMESPEEIADSIRVWRASIIGHALRELPRRTGALSLVRAAAGEDVGSRS